MIDGRVSRARAGFSPNRCPSANSQLAQEGGRVERQRTSPPQRFTAAPERHTPELRDVLVRGSQPNRKIHRLQPPPRVW